MSKKRIVRWTICFAVITALTVVFFILELVSGSTCRQFGTAADKFENEKNNS